MKKTFLVIFAMGAIIAVPLTFAQAQTNSPAAKQKLAANFAQADANRDAALTYDEFVKMLQLNAQDNLGRAPQIVKSGNYRTAFNRIDADRNGLLTQQELLALAR
jgi:Ca2+-binding EF-hand superfamily protein